MLGLGRSNVFVLDFATLADGRAMGIMTSGLVTGRVIVPDLDLYRDANSALLERAKTALARLGEQPTLKVRSVRVKLEGPELEKTARRYKARVVTIQAADNLAKDVPVTTVEGIYETMRPVYLPGADILVKIVKRGKEQGEGIGYLEGGVKVVVDDGGDLVGKEAEVVILGALDTAVGRVVFARPKYTEVK